MEPYQRKSCTEIKSLLSHLWNAVFDDNVKVWNPTAVTKEHDVLYEGSFCAHFVVGVSYAGHCLKIKSAYVICLFLMSVFFPLCLANFF